MASNINTRKPEWREPPAEEEGLRRYVETIRERIGLVALATLVTTLVAIAYVIAAPKVYEARADMLIIPVATEDAAIRSLPLIFQSVDPTRDVETASQFVTNLDVANRVRDDLGLDDSARDLLGRISAVPVAQSNIVSVTAEADSPDEAQELANAFAAATVEDRTAQVHEAADRLIIATQANLEASESAAAREEAEAALAQLETYRSAPDPSVRVETEADLPVDQTSPRPTLSIAGGILAGLVLGIAGAFASQVLDTRLRRETQLRRLYRLPILARIPKERGGATKRFRGRDNDEPGERVPLGPAQISGVGAEAYRTLRATLEAGLPAGGGSRVIFVTGPSPSEGKSTTAANLASSLALAGRRVILIDADLRRPALAKTFEVEPAHGGVVSVLIENTALEDALTTTPTYGQNLKLLLADYEGGWIADLFSIPAAKQMLEDARRLADYVIIDSPPLNEVVDALPLAREADDVLIVVRIGRTRIDRIAQLAELLAENGIKPVGFALVGVPRPSRSEYTYYQGRGGSKGRGGSQRRGGSDGRSGSSRERPKRSLSQPRDRA